MIGNNIEIKYVKNWNINEVVNLYRAGGWWKESWDPSGIPSLIKGSEAFIVAIDSKTNETIGMGRLISDGVSDAYIQDVVVLPNYRNRGIGQKIVQNLVKYCKSNGISWIGLIAEPNQDNFYSPLGFKPLTSHIPMKYED
jgi:ribosomal protein S18 acetylase RimI-like enzyme